MKRSLRILCLAMALLLCGGLLKVVANRVLVADPAIGIKGAAVGTLCCYVLITLINLIAIYRCVPQRPDYFAVLCKPVVITAIMAVVARGGHSLLDRLLHGSGVATLLAIGLAVLVYGAAALVLGAVKRQDLLALPKGEKIADFLRIS